jgi:hypothetical protein
LRVSNALNRESKKLLIRNTKESKEESKKRRTVLSDKNKIRAQYRKDFSSELKRIRGDANISVLQFFDEEEDREERDQHIKHSLTNSSSSSSSSFSSPTKNGPKVPKGSETPKDLKDLKNSTSQIPDKFVEKDERMRVVFKSLPTCSKSFFGQSSSGYSSVTSSLLSNNKSRIQSDNNDNENGSNHDNKNDNVITLHNKNFNGIDNENEKMHEKKHENEDENEVMNWDDVFQTINCLYTFSDFLQLQMSVKINSFVSKVARISNINNSMSNSLRSVASSSGPKGINSDIIIAGNDSENPMDSVTENNGSENTKNNDSKNSVEKIEKGSEMKMDVVGDESNDGKEKNSKKGDKNEKVDEEDEWDENEDHTKKHYTDNNIELRTDSIDNNDNHDNDENFDRNNKDLLEAHADLDRVHLCLVHALATDLHTLLDLDETDKGLAVKFPLNQV